MGANHFNNLDRASVRGRDVCVMVCVITCHFASCGKAFIAVRFASMRTCEYRSSILEFVLDGLEQSRLLPVLDLLIRDYN